MRIHPSEKIMLEVINEHWSVDSIVAAIADADGHIIAKGKTTVNDDCDPTAHAEVNAIRAACRKLGVSALPKGCWLYTSFEPCPMCASAAVWAKLDGVAYANNPTYRGREDDWSFVACEEILKRGDYLHHVELTKDLLIDEIKGYFTTGHR